MNTDFYKLSRGVGKSPLYFQNLLRTIEFAKKDGAQVLKMCPNDHEKHLVEAFFVEEMHMASLHKLHQALNRTKKADLHNQFGKKIGEIKALSFFKNLEPSVENLTQQYVEKRAGK